MTIPSNLYAEKVFAEHPLNLWSLDEPVDYISLIADTDRSIAFSWETLDADTSSQGSSSFSYAPFKNLDVSKVSANAILTQFGKARITGPKLLDRSQSDLAMSFYIYADNDYSISYSIGYYYQYDGQDPVYKIKTVTSNTPRSWILVSNTFKNVPTDTDVYPIIDISYANGGIGVTYDFYINGFTAGFQSEEFLATSLGVSTDSIVDISSQSGVLELSGTAAKTYGLKQNDAYYCIKNGNLLAKNSGIPMVYGASSVTRLYPGDGSPSLIFPNSGMLTSDGANREFTLEFWIRGSVLESANGRILGPVGSLDGVYIDGRFIKLKIGSSIGSFYVNNWFRPMLIDIRYSPTSATLLINAEEVISIDLSNNDKESMTSSDWSVFNVPDGVKYFEIDAMATYSYLVPSIVAKRRMVFAQAVESPDGNSKTFGGRLALADYSFADYTNNYSYPDIGRFDQGIYSNLSINKTSISPPDYGRPSLIFKSSNFDSWISNSQDLPSVLGYNGARFLKDTGHFKIDSFNILKEKIAAMYGIFNPLAYSQTFSAPVDGILSTEMLVDHYFETGDMVTVATGDQSNTFFVIKTTNSSTISLADSRQDALSGIVTSEIGPGVEVYTITYSDEQTLFLVKNKINSDTFRVSLDQGGLKYSSNINGIDTVLLFEPGIAYKPFITVGLDINNLSSFFDVELAEFFDNPNQLEMYVASDPDFSKRFIGDIYRFGLCNSRNYSKISDTFSLLIEQVYDAGSIYFGNNPAFWSYVLDGGYPDSDYGLSKLLGHNATYTIIINQNIDTVELDIATDSFWQDHIALSHFSQYTTDIFGNPYYDLDFIQFNIGFSSIQDTSSGYFDTTGSNIKTYVSFQYLSSGSSSTLDTFQNISKLPRNRVVSPGDEWVNTAYEVVDGTIIAPPKNVRIDQLAIVTHIEMSINGVLANPLLIKRIEYASEAFNESTANPVGTRFGVNLYPYTKYSSYFDYKEFNPFITYKRSTPHLYLTDSSGMEVVGNFDSYANRGFLIPINENAGPDYKVKSFQMFMLPKLERFSSSPQQVLEIEDSLRTIRVFVKAINSSGTRGVLYAINSTTGQVFDGIAYYVNGSIVKDPVITINEWLALGVSFSTPLNFDFMVGAIRITGPFLFNAMSFYESSKLEEVERQAYRNWGDLTTYGSENLDQQWGIVISSLDGIPSSSGSYTWGEVLIISSIDFYGAEISSLYGSYIGTNKLIVDNYSVTSFGKEEYLIKTNMNKVSFITTPV